MKMRILSVLVDVSTERQTNSCLCAWKPPKTSFAKHVSERASVGVPALDVLCDANGADALIDARRCSRESSVLRMRPAVCLVLPQHVSSHHSVSGSHVPHISLGSSEGAGADAHTNSYGFCADACKTSGLAVVLAVHMRSAPIAACLPHYSRLWRGSVKR